MRSHLLLFACGSTIASSAVADIKGSGSYDCDKAELSYAVPVQDHPGHVFQLQQSKCRWTKMTPIGGNKHTVETDVVFVDVTDAGVKLISTAVTTYENGDKTFQRSTGTARPDGTASGRFTFTGGTGKLQGIKGGGTWKCKSAEPGGAHTCDATWTYNLAAPKKKS